MQVLDVVLIQYALPATAVRVEPVIIVCHSNPLAAASCQAISVPSEVNNWPTVPVVKIDVTALAFP